MNNKYLLIFKKSIIIIFVLTILNSTVIGSSVESPVHTWSMDKLFGNMSGFPTATTNDCKAGGCISFDGSSCTQDGSGSISTIQENATYTLWMKTGSDVTNLQYIFTQNKKNTNLNDVSMARGFFIQDSWLYVFSSDKNGIRQILPYEIIKSNTWYFLALSQSENNLDVFINGNITVGLGFTGSINTYLDSWGLGCLTYSASNSFKGKLDDINVYSSALSQDIIFQAYQNPLYPNVPNNNASTTSNNNFNFNFNINISGIIHNIMSFLGVISMILVIAIPISAFIYSKKNNEDDDVIRENIDFEESNSPIIPIRDTLVENNSQYVYENETTQHILCPLCSAEVKIGEGFCPNCGKRVD